jgi:hypothetical protein
MHNSLHERSDMRFGSKRGTACPGSLAYLFAGVRVSADLERVRVDVDVRI